MTDFVERSTCGASGMTDCVEALTFGQIASLAGQALTIALGVVFWFQWHHKHLLFERGTWRIGRSSQDRRKQ